MSRRVRPDAAGDGNAGIIARPDAQQNLPDVAFQAFAVIRRGETHVIELHLVMLPGAVDDIGCGTGNAFSGGAREPPLAQPGGTGYGQGQR